MRKLKSLFLMLSGYAITKLPENNGWWNLVALLGMIYVFDQLFGEWFIHFFVTKKAPK